MYSFLFAAGTNHCKFSGLKHQSVILQFGGQKSKGHLTGLQSRCQQDRVPFAGSRGDSVFLPFPASSGCLCFLAHGSLSPFPKPAIAREVFSHDAFSLVPILLPPLPRFKDPMTTLGHWVSQENFQSYIQLISNLYFSCDLHSPLTGDILYSQDLICCLDLGEDSTQRWTEGIGGRQLVREDKRGFRNILATVLHGLLSPSSPFCRESAYLAEKHINLSETTTQV